MSMKQPRGAATGRASRKRLPLCVEQLEGRALLAALADDSAAQDALRDELLGGVSSIADMGWEGTVAVFGDAAVSILKDGDHKTVVAAADNGAGRVVAAAKTGFADFANADVADTARFYRNVVNWASHGKGTEARILTDNSSAREWLSSHGYGNVVERSDWENGLDAADVLVVYCFGLTSTQQSAATSFLAAGGGMFVGYNGWAFGYASLTPITSGGNEVLRQVGLSWTEDVSWSFDGTINRGSPAANASLAGAVCAAPGQYSATQQADAIAAMRATFQSVPVDDPRAAAVRRSVLSHVSSLVPTPDSPVGDANEKVRLQIEAAVMPYLPADELFAHRSAASYGAIPADAPRVTKTVDFAISPATAAPQWLSTGLYAGPGEVVTVTLPATLLNRGWSIKIGSHTDDIWDHEAYERMPFGISRDFPIDATSLEVGSVYGGMIYLVKPPTTGSESVAVTFAGALEAPYFVLGRTTDAEWATLKTLPAPYAELACDGVVITLHSDDIRLLTNPTAVMTYWAARMAVQDDLADFPSPRTSPERINDDLAISVGWMHSGYPVMAFAHNLAHMVDSDPGDDWGFFHEFGHNHQAAAWTFDTEVEVTVNIFTMRAFDSAASVPSDDWSAMWTPSGRAARVQSFIANGRNRGRDAGDSLTAYAQLREAFGWEPFRQFFRQYHTDTANLPQTDQEKRDQWVTRFSGIVGRNLGPFFQGWGFNPSQTALAAVAGLPSWTWLEAVSPNPTVTAPENASVAIDPRTGFVDLLEGPLTVKFTRSPAHGSLTAHNDGSFTYTPTPGFTGSESLAYSIRNDHGGMANGTVTVNVTSVPLRAESVTMPEARAYRAGETIRFTVVLSQPVTVAGGRPTIDVFTGSGRRSATYASGSGSSRLVFEYVVKPGDDAAGLVLGRTIRLPRAATTIRDGSLRDLPLGIPGGVVPGVSLDTIRPLAPALVLGSGVARGATLAEATRASGVITVAAEAGCPIAVTLQGTAGSLVRTIVGEGPRMRMPIVLASGDATTLGDGVVTVSATAVDAAGNRSFSAGTRFTIDTLPPVSSSILIPVSRTYRPGEVLRFTVIFSERVRVRGTPFIPLTLDGGVPRRATFVRGSGTKAAVFEYRVRPGDKAALGPTLAAEIAAFGGTLADAAGNVANPALASPSLAGVVIAPKPPRRTART